MGAGSECDTATAGLRALVDLGTRAAFLGLDLATGRASSGCGGPSGLGARGGPSGGLEGGELGPLMRTSSPRKSYGSFAALFGAGEHLEHFHLYEPGVRIDSTPKKDGAGGTEGGTEGGGSQGPNGLPAGAASAAVGSAEGAAGARSGPDKIEMALEMHTDNGLLIAVTAGLEGSTPGGGGPTKETGGGGGALLLSLPHTGAVVRLAFPPGALLLLAGEGAQAWLLPETGASTAPAPPRAAPHALVLPWLPGTRQGPNSDPDATPKAEGGSPQWRAWHGRCSETGALCPGR